jgi:uncharacterized low-complexity protein
MISSIKTAIITLAFCAAVAAPAIAADRAAPLPPVPSSTGQFAAPTGKPAEYKCGDYKGGAGQTVTWCGCSGISDCNALSKLCSGPMMEDGDDPSQGGCIVPHGTPSS